MVRKNIQNYTQNNKYLLIYFGEPEAEPGPNCGPEPTRPYRMPLGATSCGPLAVAGRASPEVNPGCARKPPAALRGLVEEYFDSPWYKKN